MRRGRKIGGALRRILATGALLLATASPAAANTLVVQPDGKIVLTGRTSPEFGALARLQADGSLDQSFGRGGFVLDQRAPAFGALALQPDGRIVAGSAAGSILARYLPEGVPDPSFSEDGIGGTPERGQSHDYPDPFPGDGNTVTVLVQPSGTLVMGDAPKQGGGTFDETRVRRYDAAGNLLETTGRVAVEGGFLSPLLITDLVEHPNGSLVGAGWASGREGPRSYTRPLLARFIPGSSADFDGSFGAGVGLVRPRIGTTEFRSTFTGLVAVGDMLIAAGHADKTFLVARFDHEGNLDPSFGQAGYSLPPIAGTAQDPVIPGWTPPSSWANDVAVTANGSILVGGGTTRWSEWTVSKQGPECTACPQPLLARFDSSGHLEQTFGQGGLRRLTRPDGSVLEAEIQQVTPLPDGKILVNGLIIRGRWGAKSPFVARLEQDGSYDSSFGAGGLVTPKFPCTSQPKEQRERAGCVASATLTLRLGGLRRGRPVISMRLNASPAWAGISSVFLDLPRGVQPTKKLRSRMRITTSGGSGGKGVVHVLRTTGSPRSTLLIQKFGDARELRVKLRRGSLMATGKKRLRRRTLRLKMNVMLAHATWGTSANDQYFVRRVG